MNSIITNFSPSVFACCGLCVLLCGLCSRADTPWLHLSSKTGDLPAPGPSTQQTGAVVADLDKDGRNDFVLSFREKGPALVWYRRTKTGWDRYVVENRYLPVEAGGAVFDVDGDGRMDILAKKPPECLEYLVVHEMAHLLEPTHNRRFIAPNKFTHAAEHEWLPSPRRTLLDNTKGIS